MAAVAPITRTERALLLLEHVAAGGPPQTHGELMRELSVPRSTLSDLLAELRDLGYLRVIDRRYAPGPRLIGLVHRGLLRGREDLHKRGNNSGSAAALCNATKHDDPSCWASIDAGDPHVFLRYHGFGRC